jgi:hypothetical protein
MLQSFEVDIQVWVSERTVYVRNRLPGAGQTVIVGRKLCYPEQLIRTGVQVGCRMDAVDEDTKMEENVEIAS